MNNAITEEDRQLMNDLASGEVTAHELNAPSKSPDPEPDDPADGDVPWEHDNKNIEKTVSKQIAEFALTRSPPEAAERYSINRRTVYRHLSVWTDDYDNKDSPSFSKTIITEPMCAVMREMGHDGIRLQEIKDKFDISDGSASKHVSILGDECSHDHNVPPVDFGGRVNSSQCDEMRRHAHQGESCREISENRPISRTAVTNHVSAAYDCDCDNDVPAVVYD